MEVQLYVLLLFVINVKTAKTANVHIHIDDGILKEISSLSNKDKFFNLSDYQLLGIAPHAFDKVTHVSSLDLSFNGFNVLPENIFSNLTNLEQLSIRNNGDDLDLTNQFSNLPKLKKLDLTENFVMFNYNTFSQLPDDTIIKLPKWIMGIEPTMFSINESKQIGKQNLSGSNCNQNLPLTLLNLTNHDRNASLYRKSDYDEETVLCMFNDVVVNIGNNNCSANRTFNRISFMFEYLSLNNKSIRSFEKNWYQLSSSYNIVELMLEGNKIAAVKEYLLNDLPQTIKFVSLRKNRIQSLENLEILNKNLRKLDLSQNEIDKIGNDTFKEVTSLVHLKLSSNNIIDLNFVATLSNTLVCLELARNNISVIPDNILSRLINLYHLDLSRNKIKVIDEKSFVGLRQLGYLYLDFNAIAKIAKGSYDHLRCTRALSFTGNKVISIEKGFARRMNNVEVLFIDGLVKVEKFERGLFYGLPSNSTVYTSNDLKSLQPGLFKNYS